MQHNIVLLTGRDLHLSVIKPFGAHKCAHELRKNGFPTLVINHINHFTSDEISRLLQAAVDQTTIMLGISTTFLADWARKNLSQISHIVKTINPRCKIVLGGAACNLNDNYQGADYVVIGYADLSIVNLARHLVHGDRLINSHRSLHGFVVINDAVAQGFDVHNSTMTWHDDDLVIGDRVLPLEVSRGCIFRCAFCAFALNGKQNGDYIKRIDTLQNEIIENYEKFGITTYRLLDDTFNDNRDKLDQIEQMTSKLPFRLQLWAYIRLDLLTKHPETIDQLVRIGIRNMAFGIETFNKATGRIIGKGLDPEQQIETIRNIKKRYGSNVLMTGQFIVGLPEESQKSVQNSIDSLRQGDIPLDGWYFSPLQIRKKNLYTWDSPFNLDMTKYGYVETGKILPNNIVHWKNPHMDFDIAQSLSASGSIGFEGHHEFEVYALGYEFHELQSKTAPISHSAIESRYYRHLEQYKTNVMTYLSKKANFIARIVDRI